MIFKAKSAAFFDENDKSVFISKKILCKITKYVRIKTYLLTAIIIFKSGRE